MAAEEPHEVGSWVRQRVLGSGGFGVVTLWKHKEKGEMIALKKCRSGTDNLLTPKHKERWSKEVEIMQRLCHPNVVRAVSVPLDLAVLRSELPLLCMEFCSKGDLRKVLNRGENCCGLPENDVRALISDVKNAVQYLHSMKITHRDLKPENIVLQHNDDRIVYKLIDLGYAKELDQSSVCTSFVGTLQYLAPELFMSKAYTSSVDYWSLGLVSHEVITGVRPFLPNMAPVSWMNHVRNKSSEDISAYEAVDGSIVFCREIFPQNHITSTLKYHIEEWFKILLEWDPKKRGRDKDNKIVVFDIADEFLNKKIVQLFCVDAYRKLSYEIDNSTAVSTLKEWIRRDTGLTVEEQELLLANGAAVDPCKEALQCWLPQNVKDCLPMVYVYRVGHFGIPQVTPCIPSSVSKMMEEPRMLLPYIHQKRAWAHAVFFLQQETELYRMFRLSHNIKLLHILSRGEQLRQKALGLSSQMQQARAELHLSTLSLQADREHLQAAGLSLNKMLQQWLKNHEALASCMNDVKKKSNDVQQAWESSNKKMVSFQSTPHVKIHEPSVLRALLDTGLKCFDQLCRRPRETRSQQTDSIEMVRVVYNCLKQRDILLRDKEFNNHLQLVVDLQKEVGSLLEPVEQCIEQVKNLRAQICQFQLERQKNIWNLVASYKPEMNSIHSHVLKVAGTKIMNHEGDPEKETQVPASQLVRQIESLKMENSLDEVPSRSGASLPQTTSNIDASEVIQKNIEIRHQTLDAMTTSYQKFMSIVSESLNWSHLD